MKKCLLFASTLSLIASALAHDSTPALPDTTETPSAPINYGVLCPAVGRSALELANARDQGKDMVAASDFVRSDFQSLGLSTSDKRIDNLVLALIPGNAAFAFERKDLKPVTIRYAAAGICAIQVAGDRNPSHVVALVDSAAKCQNMLKPELRENVLASCVAAEISNLESGK
jgi:hypothetical protein